MRTLFACCISVLAVSTLAPTPILAQLPAGCKNNLSTRCAQPLSLNKVAEGLVGGPGNHQNYFVIDVRRTGLYDLLTTRDPHPRGNSASIRIEMVDSEGSRLLRTWLQGSELEQSDPIEISTPGQYFVNMAYNTGNAPVRFTLRLRPRANN